MFAMINGGQDEDDDDDDDDDDSDGETNVGDDGDHHDRHASNHSTESDRRLKYASDDCHAYDNGDDKQHYEMNDS